MSKILSFLLLSLSFNICAEELTYAPDNINKAIKISRDGKLIIDLKKVKIEDILLRDGSVIELREIDQLQERSTSISDVLLNGRVIQGGTDGGGG